MRLSTRPFERKCLGMRLGVLWLTWHHVCQPSAQHVTLYKAHVNIIFDIVGYVTFDIVDDVTQLCHICQPCIKQGSPEGGEVCTKHHWGQPSRTPTPPDVTGRQKISSRTITSRATTCSPRFHPEGEVSTGASKLGQRDWKTASISRPSDC